jgi:hypothetical protein
VARDPLLGRKGALQCGLVVYLVASGLTSVLSGQPAVVIAQARTGLAQALTHLGGAHSTGGIAARGAYSSGLDLAMIVGSGLVIAVALALYRALPATGKARRAQRRPSPDLPQPPTTAAVGTPLSYESPPTGAPLSSALGGIRTPNLLIRSQML